MLYSTHTPLTERNSRSTSLSRKSIGRKPKTRYKPFWCVLWGYCVKSLSGGLFYWVNIVILTELPVGNSPQILNYEEYCRSGLRGAEGNVKIAGVIYVNPFTPKGANRKSNEATA